MRIKNKRVLICDCEGSMPLEAGKLAKACAAAGADDADGLELNTFLCRAQLGNFQQQVVIRGDEEVIVACTQESPIFEETREDSNPQAVARYTNIRERAGWSEEGADAAPKIAALLAEAALDPPGTTTVSMESEGIALVYGTDEQALEAASQLSGRLNVTVLVSQPDDLIPPRVIDVPIFKGTITAAQGHLGGFGINVDDYAPMLPSARGPIRWEPAKNGAFSECDLILDLSGGAPLFPAHEKRDGYFRPEPGNPAAVQKALFDMADMVGAYDKPRYVKYDGEICAHGRSQKTGCTRCLDVCPASAISPDGDQVSIDPFICGGCGSCHSVCPTGAATYNFPPAGFVYERLQTLLDAYHKAGGADPVLLVHDPHHGDDVIAMMARFGRGLPARVIPFALNEVTQAGLDLFAVAMGYGVGEIRILVPPKRRDELDGLAAQIELSEAMLAGLGYGEGRIALLSADDPDGVEAELWDLAKRDAPAPGAFMPMGGKRSVTMLALRQLHKAAPEPADVLPLPAGAPFGRIEVDTGGCTMCLACVGSCPTGALLENPERPQLSFNQEACVQCGLCQTTCPESVIKLVPELNLSDAARGAVVLNEEPPFCCIRCGKPFGTQSAIEAITEKLTGHSMFAGAGQLERIQMCEDCRVVVQFNAPEDPFKGPPRPAIRTTDDDLREREIEEARAKLLKERAEGKTEH
ncbi:MAG: 4Fe-4S binding protein [Alphaproteobacteria bacterium]|nr:4Fe-4S binding protein [Alphaproteobacteria bacterium]